MQSTDIAATDITATHFDSWQRYIVPNQTDITNETVLDDSANKIIQIKGIVDFQVIMTHLLDNMVEKFKQIPGIERYHVGHDFSIQTVISNVQIAVETPLIGRVNSRAGTCNRKDCRDIIDALITIETTSTVYMLSCLANSVIDVSGNGGGALIFNYTGKSAADLTGLWDTDKHVLRMDWLGGAATTISPKLLFGFGPSASGKTFHAKNIVQLIGSSDPQYPARFISIDGGTYREVSRIYTMFVQKACPRSSPESCKIVRELVVGGIKLTVRSMFDSDIMKRGIIKYLDAIPSMNARPSLYVPETLGGCASTTMSVRKLALKQCNATISKYVKITGDSNYIPLLIYQHKIGKDCSLDASYRCMGCTESGKSREGTEGKKYSSAAWYGSMINGLAVLNQNGILIHNSGTQGKKSIMVDFRTNNDKSGVDPKLASMYRFINQSSDVLVGITTTNKLNYSMNRWIVESLGDTRLGGGHSVIRRTNRRTNRRTVRRRTNRRTVRRRTNRRTNRPTVRRTNRRRTTHRSW